MPNFFIDRPIFAWVIAIIIMLGIPAFLQFITGSLSRVPILLLATRHRGCARCGT